VQPEGKVAMAKLPARIPVVGKNGTITGYTSLHLAPTLTPAQAARDKDPARGRDSCRRELLT
jgi:hypothetical protein